MPGKKTKRQVRKSSIATKPAVSTVVSGNGARTSDREFAPDYGYVLSDLRRIGIQASGFLLVLIVLAIFLR